MRIKGVSGEVDKRGAYGTLNKNRYDLSVAVWFPFLPMRGIASSHKLNERGWNVWLSLRSQSHIANEDTGDVVMIGRRSDGIPVIPWPGYHHPSSIVTVDCSHHGGAVSVLFTAAEGETATGESNPSSSLLVPPPSSGASVKLQEHQNSGH